MSDLSGCVCENRDCCDLSGCPCDVSGSCCETQETELIPASDEQTLVENTWGLRLRNSIQQISEGTANLQILHPLTRPPSFERLADYNATTEKLNEIYLQSMVCLLRFFMIATEILRASWNVTQKTYVAVRDSFRENVYVFFEGSSFPYKVNDLHLDSPGVPTVEWYYNATTNTFITARLNTNSEHFTKHHIPYLAAQIKYDDLTLYDISEFINSVRWAGEEGEAMPTVDHLVSAWTLSSGIVLRRSNTMVLSVINTDGNDVQIPLRNEA